MELRRFRGLFKSGAMSLSEIAKETGLNVERFASTCPPKAQLPRLVGLRPDMAVGGRWTRSHR